MVDNGARSNQFLISLATWSHHLVQLVPSPPRRRSRAAAASAAANRGDQAGGDGAHPILGGHQMPAKNRMTVHLWRRSSADRDRDRQVIGTCRPYMTGLTLKPIFVTVPTGKKL